MILVLEQGFNSTLYNSSENYSFSKLSKQEMQE
jgi:hypothetical protein